MRTMAVVLLGVTLFLATMAFSRGANGQSGNQGGAADPTGQGQQVKGGQPSFLADVMPVLNRTGCSTVACHGSQKGKGGLNFSMFGADPQSDYEALTKADGGRRINKVEPAKSLLLLKATGGVRHAGKQRFEPNSHDYQVIAAWIAGGAILARENEPALVSLEVAPAEQVLQPGQSVQLTATARFSDHSSKDVTRQTRYSLTQEGVCSVDLSGKVTAAKCGEVVVIASYLRQPTTVRIIVPQTLPTPFPEVQPGGRVDELVIAKWKLLGIPPSEVCSDAEFLRRVSIDLTGTLPKPDEVRRFLASRNPQRRAKLIDKLLASEEFADFWAMKWCDLFRVKSEFPNTLWPNAVQAYHRWVRMSIAGNKPYDQFVRELLTATGSNFREPPSNFYRAFLKKDPQNVAEVAALTFMGARIGCARCHGHPTENWTTDDNLGVSAFFAQVKYKATMEWKEEIVYLDPKQVMRKPKTGEVIKPKLPGGQVVELDGAEDARARFAQWLTATDNPWFARNIVNRTWFWLLGRGIVHEPDDLRPTNPPENPQLLDYLAQELVSHQYDLKHIYRLILNSRPYQLSSRTNQWNRDDAAHFSHYYVKRLGAETLLDAIGQVTDRWDTYRSIIPEPFVVLPPSFRATHLSDGSVSVPFLELFGRPPRDTAFESDRDLELYLRQTLHLLNSTDVQTKVATSPWLVKVVKEATDESKIIEGIYLATVSRYPSDAEKAKAASYLAEVGKGIPESVTAEVNAASEALATAQQEQARANSDFEAAQKAAREAEQAVAKVKPKDTAARAAASALVIERRRAVTEAKNRRDKAPTAIKTATTRGTEANKQLTSATAAAKVRREQAIQDLLWALLNSKEFVFNH